jgi:hypothetical protein
MTPKRSSVVNHTKPNVKFLAQLRKRYAKATKKQRMAILDEFVATTGYHRKHASALLSGKRQWRDPAQAIHRQRRQLYTETDRQAVLWLVELFDQDFRLGLEKRQILAKIPVKTTRFEAKSIVKRKS